MCNLVLFVGVISPECFSVSWYVIFWKKIICFSFWYISNVKFLHISLYLLLLYSPCFGVCQFLYSANFHPHCVFFVLGEILICKSILLNFPSVVPSGKKFPRWGGKITFFVLDWFYYEAWGSWDIQNFVLSCFANPDNMVNPDIINHTDHVLTFLTCILLCWFMLDAFLCVCLHIFICVFIYACVYNYAYVHTGNITQIHPTKKSGSRKC